MCNYVSKDCRTWEEVRREITKQWTLSVSECVIEEERACKKIFHKDKEELLSLISFPF